MNKGSKAFLRGFALPTVIIASVVVIGVLVGASALAASVRNSLVQHYYTQLAREASEAGVARAESCLRDNEQVPQWSSAKPLQPNTDCSGDVDSTLEAYVVSRPDWRTKFSVSVAVAENGGIRVTSQGTVERLRTSNGQVWERRVVQIGAQASTEPMYATDTSSGIQQVCVILSGETWCTGSNHYGQIGNGMIEPDKLYVSPEKVLREEGVLLGKKDRLVASGRYSTCVVATDNEIYCWGRTNYGQLGNGTLAADGPISRPTHVEKPAEMTGQVTAIVKLSYATCAVAGGDVWCWGINSRGQLGTGNTTQYTRPAHVSVIGASRGLPVTDIASHPVATSVCAVAGGQAYCWGDNRYRQLGNNTTADYSNVPVPVYRESGQLLGKTVSQVISSGSYSWVDDTGQSSICPAELPATGGDRRCYKQAHACARTTDGQMYCWGSNIYGQLGIGSWDYDEHSKPRQVLGNLNGKFVRDMAASYSTTCALTTEPDTGNRFYCWGSNKSGAGGFGHSDQCDNTPSLQMLCAPYPVVMESSGLANKYITSIDAGINRTCAVAYGVSYCMGVNTRGQLGDGTLVTRTVPTDAKVLRQYRPALIY